MRLMILNRVDVLEIAFVLVVAECDDLLGDLPIGMGRRKELRADSERINLAKFLLHASGINRVDIGLACRNIARRVEALKRANDRALVFVHAALGFIPAAELRRVYQQFIRPRSTG